jgi:outer membrane receptor for Fe3+-dicitrate
MSERAALNLLCSISNRFTGLCLYMTIAYEWRVAMGPETHEECVQLTHSNLAAYVLHAVQPKVCTTVMLAKFNQTLEAW